MLLVHLHGKASRARRQDEIVFDISSYVNSLRSGHTWHKVFGDTFPVEPFIVMGASLDEEIDLHSFLEEGRARSLDTPSLIILKEMSAFQREEYQKYGLVPVEMTGERFIEDVLAALPGYFSELTPSETLTAAGLPSEVLRFTGQWRKLEALASPNRDEKHDLYIGHEPTWLDAVGGYISRRELAETLVRLATAELKAGEHAVAVVAGEAFSGKSALALDAASFLVGRGYAPYVLTRESAVDLDALFWWLARFPKTYLIVDDAQDFARDMAKALGDERARAVSIRAVLLDRDYRARHIESELIATPHYSPSLPPRLTRTEVLRLLEKLGQKSRLGVLTTASRAARLDYFTAHDRKLFSAMAGLEDGRGFQTRVRDEFENVTDPDGRRLLAATALANRLGYSLPLTVARSTAGVSSREAEELARRDELASLLSVDSGKIDFRHRYFGELAFSFLPGTEKKRTIIQLALAVAPHVSIPAISQATIYYRLARSLMNGSFLVEQLGGDFEQALDVYGDLEEAYDWNSRYWEQRALTAADAGKYEPAFSWAKQAVRRREDSYTLNTVGTVLMKRAVYEASGGSWPTTSFEAAEENLDRARLLENTEAEYPMETFFTYVVRLVEKVPHRDQALDGQLKALWAKWYATSLLLDEPSRRRVAPMLEAAKRAWAACGMDA